MKPDFSKELQNLPFVRIFIPLVLGILFQDNFMVLTPIIFGLISISILFFIGFTIIKSFHFRFAQGLSVFAVFFFLGAVIFIFKTPITTPDTQKQTVLIGEIASVPVFKDSSIRCLVEVKSLKTDSCEYPAGQNIIAYFKRQTGSDTLQYGDRILIYGHVQPIKNPNNPDEFDYKTYLYRQSITGQIFVKTGDYRILEHQNSWSLTKTANDAKQKLASIYKENQISGQEYAVLSALTLGDQTEIDPEIKTAFAVSGTTHVLSVSGMHVGLIFIVLNFFFKFLDKLKTKQFSYGRILKAFIIISFLIFYAVLTGLSPSVRRAVVMFSFVMIGSALQRPHQIYNTMAASAFVLLIFNPFLIFDIGFQLSYLAVFSIIFLQKRIENILYFKNWFLDKIWILTSVSIAAQIITTPLTLYYFHQFPNWFWLSNIIIIPLTTIIIYAAIALLVLSPIPFIGALMGKIVNYLLIFLNQAVRAIEHLPYAAAKNVAFENFDLIFWYTILLFAILFILKKNIRFLYTALGTVFIYLSVVSYYNIENSNNHVFAVYNIKGKSVFTLISKDNNYLVSDTSLDAKTKIIKYAAGGFLQKNNVKSLISENYKKNKLNLELFKKNQFINFKGLKIYVINNKNQTEWESSLRISVDYIVIGNNPYISIEKLKQLFNFKTVIFDSSNKQNRIERWQEECKKLGVKYHSIVQNGAFVHYF